MADSLDEEALLGLAGDDRRAGIAAPPHTLARVETQTTLDALRRGRMTSVAMPDQDRTDALFEELDARRRVRRGARSEREQDECQGDRVQLGRHAEAPRLGEEGGG